MKQFLVYLALIILSGNSLATELLIIHSNDFHGHIAEEKNYAGAAKIAAYVRNLRSNHPRVLFVDAGDAITGTPVSSLFEGEPIFHIMNAMGYDVGLLGNHEFDHGVKKIATFKNIADFPLLGATALDADNQIISDKPFTIIKLDDLKIGIIGILTDSTPLLITPHGNENLTFRAPEKVLSELVPDLKPQVDFLMVLSHTGFEEDIALAKQFQDIDLIVGGHSHTFNQHPVKSGRTWVVQADHYGQHLGYVKVNFTDTKGQYRLTGDLLAADELPQPDLKVLALVESYEEKVRKKVDLPIWETDQSLSKEEIQPLFERIIADHVYADLGFYNLGGIRDSIDAGVITIRNLWSIEPFGNTLVTVTLSGADYLVLLSQEPKLHHSAADIDPNRSYTIATNNFVASHARQAFGSAIKVQERDLLIRDLLIEYISKNGLE